MSFLSRAYEVAMFGLAIVGLLALYAVSVATIAFGVALGIKLAKVLGW